MDMQTKSAAVEIKTNSTPGEFTAVISAIGNIDRQNDRAMPGSFKSAIEHDPVPPVYWAHKHEIPPIGEGLDWFEKGTEIHYQGRLFVKGDDSHQYALMVYPGMKSEGGRAPAISQFSYTYGIPEGGAERVFEDGKAIRNLLEIRPVAEVGPCFLGANSLTYLTEPAKSVAQLVKARGNAPRGTSMKEAISTVLGLEGKDYGDVEGYEIRQLLSMLDHAVSYMQWEENGDDVLKMQAIAQQLVELLTSDLAEVPNLVARGEELDAAFDAVAAVGDGKTVAATEKPKTDDEPVEPEAAVEPEVEASTGESAEGTELEAAPGNSETAAESETEGASESGKSATAVSSDAAPTVMDEALTRLLSARPTH